MHDSPSSDSAIATMPRGGPNASRLDRLLQTDALEYTDRYDVPDEVKQTVIDALDWMGSRTGQHERQASTALEMVSDIAHPRVLELGAGHGKLSASIVALHPTATVTVSDLDPTSVAKIAAGELGSHPRIRTQVVDATAIDADDGSYDLVVFAAAFHHLPPATAHRAIAETTRVGTRFLVIDIRRPHPLGLLLMPVFVAPVVAVALTLRPVLRRVVHDGIISALRAYSPDAFVALGRAADPLMRIEFLPAPSRFGSAPVAVVFARAGTAPTPSAERSVHEHRSER